MANYRTAKEFGEIGNLSGAENVYFRHKRKRWKVVGMKVNPNGRSFVVVENGLGKSVIEIDLKTRFMIEQHLPLVTRGK